MKKERVGVSVACAAFSAASDGSRPGLPSVTLDDGGSVRSVAQVGPPIFLPETSLMHQIELFAADGRTFPALLTAAGQIVPHDATDDRFRVAAPQRRVDPLTAG